MRKFKIFYSWQSDLPGNKTRNFIRECIDEAIDLAQETEAIEAERDEATIGTTGSPDIVATLFSKIDDCDLFVADISLCFTEDQKNEKRSPNPNVLLELGYAVKKLGWSRIICLCNTDFGNQYPFDIAHNRITDYSLEGKSRKEIKSDLSRIIFTNIRDLRNQPPRAKAGFATHILGTYDFEKKKVVQSLRPVKIEKQESYTLHNKELIDDASQLIVEIQELSARVKHSKTEAEEKQVVSEIPSPSLNLQSQYVDAVRLMSESFNATESPVTWENKGEDTTRIKKWLGVEVADDFFELGGLKKKVQILDLHNTIITGTDEEKEKYDKLSKLSYKLLLLDVRTEYLKSFKGMYFLPLAIQNISDVQDQNIRVVITMDEGEIIEPDEHLIWDEFEGLQGYICRNDDDRDDVGIICELFGLEEDGVIHIEDIPYDPSRYMPKAPILTINGFSQPDKTEEDYRQELEEFIASTGGKGFFEFDVKTLLPKECRWLCCGLLIKPTNNTIKLHYQILSSHSTGDLNGSLQLVISGASSQGGC